MRIAAHLGAIAALAVNFFGVMLNAGRLVDRSTSPDITFACLMMNVIVAIGVAYYIGTRNNQYNFTETP